MVGGFINVLPVGKYDEQHHNFGSHFWVDRFRDTLRDIPGRHYYEYNIVVGVGVDCHVCVFGRAIGCCYRYLQQCTGIDQCGEAKQK